MVSMQLPLKRWKTVTKFGFDIKRAKQDNRFLNSYQNLVLQISELGDLNALRLLERKIKDPKTVRAHELANLNRFINRNLADRFERTVLQMGAMPREDVEKALLMTRRTIDSLGKAGAQHAKYIYSTAKKFGVPKRAMKGMRVPPFYEIQKAELGKNRVLENLHPLDDKVDFKKTRQIEDKIVPTQNMMKRRMYDQSLGKSGSSGIAFNGMSVVRTGKGERVLLVDIIQTFPRTKKIEEGVIIKESFPEYRDFQKLMLLDAFRTADELGVKKVFLPDSKSFLDDGSITKNIKRRRDELGKTMHGKELEIVLSVSGKKTRVNGFFWSKR